MVLFGISKVTLIAGIFMFEVWPDDSE
jgi:hypothetical protein